MAKIDGKYEQSYTERLLEQIESEDEKIRQAIIQFLIDFNNGVYTRHKEEEIANWIAWLEKQGEQKPVEWSEEDKKMFESALWHVKNSCSNGGKNSGEFKVYNWLNSLKDRFLPQKIEF